MHFAHCEWSAAVSARSEPRSTEDKVVRPWHEYTEGLRYMRASPLILGIALVAVGWASGGGAAQILFSLFGELVFQSRTRGHRLSVGRGRRSDCSSAEHSRTGSASEFRSKAYKRTITICYVIHGGSYVIFSQMRDFRTGAAVSRHLARGRRRQLRAQHVATAAARLQTNFAAACLRPWKRCTGPTMMLSMAGAGVASQTWSPRTIGVVSGLLSSSTAFFWLWANWTGRLPEPAREGVEPEEIEVHGDPVV